MKRTLTLAVLLLSMGALAQTTTTQINGGFCRQISNCQVPLANGNRIWVDYPSFVDVLDASGNIVSGCTDIVKYSFQWLSSPPPSATNLSNVPFSLSVQCDTTTTTTTVNEQGYGYYSSGSGGRVGGAGVRYQVTGGTVSY